MDEEIVDCLMEVDKTLEELEGALQEKDIRRAMFKLKEARAAIEDLREDDEASFDRDTVENDMMKKIQ
jgi:hypothetical protein